MESYFDVHASTPVEVWNIGQLQFRSFSKSEKRDKISFSQIQLYRQDIICQSYLVSPLKKVRKETRCFLVNFDFRDKIEFV